MSEPSITSKDEEQFRDGLLWIGGSYGFIECSQAENCAIPTPSDLSATRGQARCFVHEAEWRGISRKVPAVPQWAVPGETRIFLAHRGGLTSAQGRIFGYFVLHRVEVLTEADTALAPPDVQQELPWGGSKDEGELAVTVYDAETGHPLRGAKVQAGPADGKALSDPSPDDRLDLSAEEEYRLVVSMPGYQPTKLAGIRVPASKRRKVAVYLKPGPREKVAGQEGEEWKQKGPDGSPVVTHRFKDGKWHPTRQKRPTAEAKPQCTEGELEWSVCADGTLIPVRVCLGGQWRDTGVRCRKERPNGGEAPEPEPAPIEIEPFALHRSCSLRLRPGAVYLVDALCARINDEFAKTLQRQGLPEQYKNARSDGSRWGLVLDGRQKFVDIATRVSGEWKAQFPERRGELVLFKETVTLVRSPQAGFRGLQRIDGEDLLAQIARGVPEPTVRIYVPRASKEAILTRREIAAQLAAKERTTFALAEDLLDSLAEIARQELSPNGPGAVQLPGIGILRLASAPASGSPADRGELETKLTIQRPVAAAGEPALSREAAGRLLDHLAELSANELRTHHAFRLPRIGTLRSRDERLDFTPAQALGVAAVNFVPDQ